MVEVPASVFVSPVPGASPKGVSVETLRGRIDLWLEESGDELVLIPHRIGFHSTKFSPVHL